MLQQAMEYFLEESKTEIINVDGRGYSTKPLHPVLEPKIRGFEATTLDSIIHYLKNNPDALDSETIIQIKNPRDVTLFTCRYGQFEQRDTLIDAAALLPKINFERWMSSEEFIIDLQAKFTKFTAQNVDGTLIEHAGDKEALLKCIGSLKSNAVRNHSDDGVTQKVEIKQGISMVGEAIVPNPVTLAPFRTFPEIEQPASQFIFRMREGNYGIEMALFEADGGAWRNVAIKRIKEYLEKEIKEAGIEGVTILA